MDYGMEVMKATMLRAYELVPEVHVKSGVLLTT